MMHRGNRGISVAIKKTSFEVLTYQNVLLDTSWNYENVCSPYTRIYIPLNGEGEVVIDGERYILKRGKIYVIPTMTKFSCKTDNSLEKIYAHVYLSSESGTDVFWGVDKILIFDDDEGVADRLLLLYDSEKINAVIETKELLLSCLIKSAKKNKVVLGEIKNYSSLIKNAIKYIKNNLSSSLSVKEVAEKLFISVITLQKRFKKEVGKPVGKFIDEMLMTSCAKELIKGKLNIGEISDKYGFCDRFYFSRKFTEFYGTSPKRYAKPTRT